MAWGNPVLGRDAGQRAGKSILGGATAILAILLTTNGALAEATIDSAVRPYFIASGAVTAIFFISVGAILIRRGNRYLRIAAAAAQWPTVTGRVVSSDVAKRIDKSQESSSEYFVPQVRYTYNPDGVGRDGRIIRPGLEDRGYPREQQARDFLAKYSVGSKVLVRYDPHSPADAVLELGQIGAGSKLFAGTLLLLIGIAGVAFAVFAVVVPSS
jgi:hypothetical protein